MIDLLIGPKVQGLTRQLQRKKTTYLWKFSLYCNSKNRTKKLKVGVFTLTSENVQNGHEKPWYRPWRVCTHSELSCAASPLEWSLQHALQPAILLQSILVECAVLGPWSIPGQKSHEDWDSDCMVASCAPTVIDGRWLFHKTFQGESWCWGRLCETLLRLAWTRNFGGWIAPP